ncbi:hypothetical protein [Winogradskyella sp. SYSU M77433]|uniref:hypothetical protein n=1 Tax=Winogradskyella sp. SYSU M77433 TaxID=3042722 RepID=UPI002481858B|nr:hypothetical protein [Winogradskyella sp. SYSU M77433]MDH7913238.1 hypothetical protein [Winogradskyella sp. SYSU M77433]
MKKLINDWKLVILLCLTLGLAPFFPEPHIVGKVRWLAGGAVGMSPMDYFDVLLHGFPFLLLVRLIILKLIPAKKESN